MILQGQRLDPSRSPKSPLPDNHHHYHHLHRHHHHHHCHHHFYHHIVIIEDKDGILRSRSPKTPSPAPHSRSIIRRWQRTPTLNGKSQLVDNSDGIDHLFNDNGILWRVSVLLTAVVVHLNMFYWSVINLRNCKKELMFSIFSLPLKWGGEFSF